MKLVRLAAVLLVVAALLALPAGAAAPTGPAEGITVTGTDTVDVAPDTAEWSFGVQTRGGTARGALSANAAQMRRVVAALRRAGVAREDIRTEYVSLYPDIRESGDVVGYFANNSVSAVVRDIGRSGALVDAAVRAGANEVSGPSLTRSNRDALYREALAAAYDQARTKAESLARKLGVSLGAPTAVVEGAAGGPEPVYDAATAELRKDVEIEPGKAEIGATVTVTFAIS